MVSVSTDIRDGVARFAVVVRAESIEQAVQIVESRYPGADVRLKSPMDPKGLFVNDPAAPGEGIVGLEQPGTKLGAMEVATVYLEERRARRPWPPTRGGERCKRARRPA